MLPPGKNTTSRIISKGIAAGRSNNTYRGLVMAHRRAKGARNFTNCDSLLIGDKCGAHTVPYIEAKNSSAVFEHEATTSKISEDTLFYCRQRGLSGKGEYRFGDTTVPVRSGDIVAAPAGTQAHQLINTGSDELRYLGISTMSGVDILDYPDSNKIAVAAGVKNADFKTASYAGLGRMAPADYYDGEDE